MALIQWNCNGLKTHFNDLKILINDINPFCIALQETHLQPHYNITLKDFNIYRKDSPDPDHSHHGVLLAIHKSVYSEPIIINSHLQVIAATIHLNFTFSVCNIYLPPQDRTIETQHLLEIYNQLPRPVLYIGDLNGHNPLWGSNNINTRGKIIENFIDFANLLLLNTGDPTFLSSTFGSLSALDLSLCSATLYSSIDWTILPDLYSSDHFPILIKFNNINPSIRVNPRWLIDKADWSLFASLASPPQVSPHDLDIEEGCEAITNVIIGAAQAAIPMTKGMPKRPPVPWFNDECKIAIKNRRRAYKIFSKSMTTENLIAYKKYRAICRRTFNYYKKESWKKFVSSINSTTTSAIVWNKVRKLTKNSSFPRITLSVNGQLTDNPSLISNTFADFFSQIYNNNINHSDVHSEDTNICNNPDDSALQYNLHFTIWELKDVLNTIKGSSPGPDNIHYEMIKNLPINTLKWLLDYYNYIWYTGGFPNSWRNSLVVPILKSGKDKRMPTSYRPIFLTSCLSKTMERMVNKRLMWMIEKNKLIQAFQSGFRKGRTTMDHLVVLEAEAQYAFVNGQEMGAVFFDMIKAFDSINHSVILQKLRSIGIIGPMFNYIKQFLTNRHFRVRVGCELSEDHNQNSGVPQGCVLSPTLFSLAINNLGLNLPRRVKPLLFADDLAIIYRSHCTTDIQNKLQESLNRLHNWTLSIGLQFSPEKTKCLLFSRKRNTSPPLELLIGNSQIPFSNHHKFLGLNFDKKLTWEHHIISIKTIALKKLNILRILSGTTWGSDRATLLKLYRALVCSKLDYGSFIYASARPRVLAKLDSVHHAGIRISTGAFRTSPTLSLCSEAGLPPLLFRRHKLAVSYISKLYTHTDHPAHKYVFEPKFSTAFRNKPNSTLPLAERISFVTSSLKDISLYKIETCTPPWTYIPPKIHLQLSRFRKQDTTTTQYQQLFRELIQSLPHHIAIYTDGSKTENSTGSAFITPNSTHKKKLHHLCNIYSAELNSIASALHFSMTNLQTNNIVIISDSISAIQGLNKMYSHHPIIQRIHEYLTMLNQISKTVHFIWAPGHVGIVGNEMADQAAKAALSLPGRGTAILTPQELARPLKEVIDKRWQAMWEESPASKLKHIKKEVKPWVSSNRSKRREEVAIARLRLGHTRMTHVYLFNREAPPICPKCDNCLTVRHIFEECHYYKSRLKRLGIPSDIKMALRDDESIIKKVITLITNCKLINSI